LRNAGRQSKRLGDAFQLAGDHGKAEQEEAAHNRGRPCADERISKAELVDRNTEPDHRKARKESETADAIKQSLHTVLMLSFDPLLNHQLSLQPRTKLFWQRQILAFSNAVGNT